MVQLKILFGAEDWVMYPSIGRNLGGFHNRLACRLENMKLRKDMTDRWVYPPLDE